MKTSHLTIIAVLCVISIAYAAPHRVPPGTKNNSKSQSASSTKPSSEAQSLESAKRLGDSGLVNRHLSNQLVKDVQQGNDRAAIANGMTAPNQLGPNVTVTSNSGQASQTQKTGSQSPAGVIKPAWRLEGVIIGGKDHSAAVFNFGNDYPVVIHVGQEVDPNTKVIAISKKSVVLYENHHKVTMMPW